MTAIPGDGFLPMTHVRGRGLSPALKAVLVAMTLALTWDAVGEFIYLLRITFFPNVAALYSVQNACSILLLLAVAIRGLLLFATSPRTPMSATQAFIIGLGLFLGGEGLLVAWIHGNPLGRPFAAQFYYWLIAFLAFTVAFSARIDREAMARIQTLIHWFSIAILVLSYLGFLVLEAYRHVTGALLYVGYPGEQLLLPLAHFGQRRQWFAVGLTMVLIVLSGKRGPMVAAAMMVIYLLSRGKIFWSILLLVLAGLLVPALPRMVTYLQQHGMITEESSLGRSLGKWMMTADLASENLTAASSGRDLEIQGAVAQIRTGLDLLIGRGFGWSFYFPDDPEPSHMVHLAYLNYIVTNGLLGALPFFLAILFGFVYVWRSSLLPHAPPLLQEVAPFLYGFLILSFTVNLLAVYVVFWSLFGLALRVSILHRRLHTAS